MKVIHQRDFKDCGVTCLEYILEYYGGFVPLEKLREDTFTNEEGTTAYHIVETLKKYQFDSYGKKVHYEELREMPLPAIIHFILPNGMQHFVVLTKEKKEEVTIMDPASGKRVLKKEQFLSLWDGIILLAIPKGLIPRMPKEKSVFFHFQNALKKEKKLVGQIIIFSIFSSLLSIVSTTYFKIGLEKVGLLETNKINLLIIIFAAMLIFKGIFQFISENLKLYLEKNLSIQYSFSFLLHLWKLPISKFISYQSGELLTRIEEIEEIKDFLEDICISFLMEIILGIISLFWLYQLNPKLSNLVGIGLGIYLLISLIYGKRVYQLVRKNIELEQNWKSTIIENLTTFLTLKHLNENEYLKERIETEYCKTIKEKLIIKKSFFLQKFLKEYYLEFLFFFLITYGILLIGKQKLELVDFITFQSMYFFVISPLKELGDIVPKFYYLKGILSKISETINLKEEDVNSVMPFSPPSIKIKGLTFSYNKIETNLNNINLEIKEKEHVFLEGASGSGKSTLCKLLHKEMENYEGEILISGKNLKDYNLSCLRSSVIYLSQKESLISATIKENILLGKEETNRYWKIVKICEIESIVKKRPFRYETSINNEVISGGEKQRIMLARTLLKEGSLYILDECLSEIEEDLELKIIKNIRIFLKEKTLIYVSHKKNSKEFDRSITIC